MKNRILLLAAATTLGFAACNNSNSDGTYTQEQLDSIVQWKEDSAANAFKMKNDSIINAQAAEAAQNQSSATSNNTSHAHTSPSTAPAVEKNEEPTAEKVNENAQDAKFEERQTGTKTTTEQQKNEQDNKFNERGGGTH